LLKRKRQIVRFIPFRKKDIVEMCLRDGGVTDEPTFLQIVQLLQSIYHFEFHQKLEALKDAYAPLNPSRDTRIVFPTDSEEKLLPKLDELLNDANYDKLGEAEIQQALEQTSLFNLQLQVDFSEFEEVALYTRGESERREQVPRFMGLFPRDVAFSSYDRVVLFIHFSKQLPPNDFNKPDSTILKLFQNVPKDDVEMLFPNTRLGMRMVDKLVLGVPAIVGGGIVLTTKMGASLILLGSLLGFYVGLSAEPVRLDQAALLALVAALGGFGSFVWRQFTKFKTRKLGFMQRLMENLYFRNLDNNAGVFHRLVDDAEEEECKEAILAYYFLLTRKTIHSAALLDSAIESWFRSEWQADIDFEVEDALDKLRDLELVIQNEKGELSPRPLDEAHARLDQRWDDYFKLGEV
tara:strand:- start:28600 stop:29820 length:1221 start_codon:yes stop_codon:yes gene_type:complete